MKFLRNELLKKHTSFKIGGPADYFCAPKNIEEICQALKFANNRSLRVAVIGAGSNLLVLDEGIRGLVIKLARGLNSISIEGNRVRVGAGVILPRLVRFLTNKGFGGAEFLVGIPGTLGGAAVMNAGAWGKRISDLIEKVIILDSKGELKTIKKRNLGYAYRKSNLQNKKWIVVEVFLKLRRKKKQRIKKRIKAIFTKRKNRHPLGIPNSGSIFKNPKGLVAGKLIEVAGGKGMRVGDAQVSVKHANFIVNLGEAKARDVIKLMTRVQKAVKDKFKILLEPEIKIMVN